MNYKPVVGWWFCGGASAAETAAYSVSWGLLGVAPTGGGPSAGTTLGYPTIPYHPVIPTMARRFGGIISILFMLFLLRGIL